MHLGHSKYSFTEMYESLNEKRGYDDLPDDKLINLFKQMKKQDLSPIAAQQFAMVIKVMKKRKIPLNEAVDKALLASKENGIKILMTAQKGIKKMSGKSTSKSLGRLIDETLIALDTQISEWKDVHLAEGSTENAKKTLDAIIGHLQKRKASGADKLGNTGRSILKMGAGIAASYKEEGGFSPDQAKWIWKTSIALFKESAALNEITDDEAEVIVTFEDTKGKKGRKAFKTRKAFDKWATKNEGKIKVKDFIKDRD